MSGFNFDAQNFGAGLLAGWATAYAIYRARHTLGSARDSLSRSASSAGEFASRSADSRYINDLIKYSESAHLAGGRIELSKIVVEPRFIPAPALAAPADDDVKRDVFRVVPIVPDHPYLHAPYNVETLAIEELDNGDRAIALLGAPGSGRTTALLTIALWSLGKVKFTPPEDQVQKMLEAEEKALNDEERAKRIKERLQTQEMAMQSLAHSRGMAPADSPEEMAEQIKRTLFKQLTPVYAHFNNILTDSSEFGRRIDPAEPLVRAVQHEVSGITARTLPVNLYERLAEGKVLLLLDGFDDVPSRQQSRKLAWLRAFKAEYGANFIIVAGPAAGYGPLLDTGLAPVFLRPWNDVGKSALVDNWAKAWPQINRAGRRSADPPPWEIVEQVKTATRGLSAMELTLKTWALFEDAGQLDYENQLRALLEKYLDNRPMGVLLPKLKLAAALQLDEGYITTARLAQIAIAQARGETAPQPAQTEPAQADLEPDDEFLDMLDSVEFDDEDEVAYEDAEPARELNTLDIVAAAAEKQDQSETPPAAKEEPQKTGKDQSKEQAKEEARITKEYADFMKSLHKTGLLIRYRRGRYQFRHAQISAYLGSLALAEMDADAAEARLYLPDWEAAVSMMALHTPLDDLVAARMDSPPDVLQNHLLEMSRWLGYAGRKVEWRTALLRKLGNMFVAPNQYRLTRERIAAALVGTRDKVAVRVFERALPHPNPDVRRLSCLGLGALRAEEHIDSLVDLLDDEDPDVALAAGLGLGAIGTDAALEEMAIALATGSENLRQAIAEAFAAIPDEGYPVLYDAILHEDIMIRRAAVFGLRRINTAWALITMYRASLEDPEWYVRSAAEQAFLEMQFGDIATGPRVYPRVESISWLREWVTEAAEDAMRPDQNPEELLRLALERGDDEIQRLSIANIGQLGLLTYTGLLYAALRHRSDDVRETAHRALADIQLRAGQPLPSPL